MIENEKFDVFIAYHGNQSVGSEYKARELYEYLKTKELYPGRKIKPYFHPATNPYGRFEDTPLIVARTPLFVLVVNKNIKRTIDGQLIRHREDGSLSNIFEEVRTFHDSPMYKRKDGEQAAKLFITDGFDFKEAEQLHPIFSGIIGFSAQDAVLDWITYFYRNTYLQMLYSHYKYLANDKKNDFIKGDWVAEANEIWQYTFDENIGRTLMIYYITRADCGSHEAVRQLQLMYKRYYGVAGLDKSTQNILQMIKDKYL